MNQTILVNETVAKVETFNQIFKNLFKYNAGEDIDIKTSKLELFIKLFDHGNKSHAEINNDDEDYENSDLPHHSFSDD